MTSWIRYLPLRLVSYPRISHPSPFPVCRMLCSHVTSGGPASLSALAERECLPKAIIPLRYDLHLEPNLSKFTFEGHEIIKIRVDEPTNKIILNAHNLEIIQSGLKHGTKSISLTPPIHDAEKQQVTFSVTDGSNLIVHQTYELSLTFRGILNEQMAGFYRSKYTTPQGEERYMAVTQFEPADARQAFPCWDEPVFKSVFCLTLTVPENRTALANTRPVKKTPIKGQDGTPKIRIEYDDSPLMSTYLVAYLVGEFEYVEARTRGFPEHGDKYKDGVLCRVYTPVGQRENGRFALQCCTRTLEFFTDYFKIPYQMDKVDLVAIPDFAAGAMENWGLITYRTVYLMCEEGKTSARAKQGIAYTVAHELAHQWFGNLVTMEWWTHLWLNEGFATWAGWRAVDHLFPEWQVWTQFISTELQHGLELDSLRSSHPIEVDVMRVADINQIFDAISYSKGASVIRMLVNDIGEDVFQKGIQTYLKKYIFSNAATDELWQVLEDVSHRPVRKMMMTWTRQTGYPLVDVHRTGDTLHLKQKRYLRLHDGEMEVEKGGAVWRVPLFINKDAVLSNVDYTLSRESGDVKIATSAPFVKLNHDSRGVFRVRYDEEMLKQLGEAAQKYGTHPPSLSAVDRVGVLSDSFELAMSTQLPTGQFLTLLMRYQQENDYIVFTEMANAVGNLRSVWFEEPEIVRNKLLALIRQLFGPRAKSLGFDPNAKEDYLTALLRPLVLSRAGMAGEQWIIDEAIRRFNMEYGSDISSSKGSTHFHPDLRSAILSIVVRWGTSSLFERVLDIYSKSQNIDEKLSALGALGLTQDEALLRRTLTWALDPENVRPQDIIYVLSAVGGNPKGRRMLWQFFLDHFTTLYDRYHDGGFIFARVITACSDGFSTMKDYETVRKFLIDAPKKDLTSVRRPIDQTLERIRIQSLWLEKNRVDVTHWLDVNVRK